MRVDEHGDHRPVGIRSVDHMKWLNLTHGCNPSKSTPRSHRECVNMVWSKTKARWVDCDCRCHRPLRRA